MSFGGDYAKADELRPRLESGLVRLARPRAPAGVPGGAAPLGWSYALSKRAGGEPPEPALHSGSTGVNTLQSIQTIARALTHALIACS